MILCRNVVLVAAIVAASAVGGSASAVGVLASDRSRAPFLSKAVAAADDTSAKAEETEKHAVDNLKVPPMAKGLAEDAKVSAAAAAEAAVKAKAAVAEARTKARAAALKAANAAMDEIERQAWAWREEQAAARAKTESDGELKSAQAAASAAAPYHQAMMKMQKLVVEYQMRAQELAVASTHLKSEAFKLTGSAQHYQYTGNVVQANQIMMTAHGLAQQGQSMGEEATRLKAAADSMMAAIPAYHAAAQAAAEAAADAAAPVVGPTPDHPYHPPNPPPAK